jgi:hypothetical protein
VTPRRELAPLEAERSRACRLTPDRALPSLFLACHEPPYRPGSSGFGLWPRTKYPWAVELTAHPGIHGLKVHRGRRVLVSDTVASVLDPLCRAALDAAAGSPLVVHLRSAGPSLVEDLQVELGLSAATLRLLREPLERTGAVMARSVTLPARTGGHRHTSELRLWPESETSVPGANVPLQSALDDLLVAGVNAAVLAPERELAQWFSWPVPAGTAERLVAEGRIAGYSSIRPALVGVKPHASK